MHTNLLIHETSPYLLQHAHNPVNWYPWCEEALEKSRLEDKPILVSIGYSACHWCHVMERESFEDETTAAIMNQNFVCIKIDREERPDLDHIYMDAVQAMTGSGGWPLNVFLTPAGKPFYGGTYFPPVQAYNRMSWKDVLEKIAIAYRNKKSELETQAENLTLHLQSANNFGLQDTANAGDVAGFTKYDTNLIAMHILEQADVQWGGFGKAPKFPQTWVIQYLLRHYYFTKDEKSLNQALLSLDKMIAGGIYDQAGGGFSRYSTDTKWLAPHFEKMLYDNALLVSVLCEAYQLTRSEVYLKTIHQTLGFTEREMLDNEKGFYSALDADSEGVEGKYYTWSKEEISQILKSDSELFCQYFGITEMGNWEHTNILWIAEEATVFCEKRGMDRLEFTRIIDNCINKLLNVRKERVRPQTDDKILLGWNALMNIAFSKAYAATGNDSYLKLAKQNIQFLEEKLYTENGWKHSYKNGSTHIPAFLEDYACLIQAYIQLQQVSGDLEYLNKARIITEYVTENFSEEATGFFYFTHKTQKDVIIRKKEVYDGATPSGNAMMALNLCQLSFIFDRSEWKERTIKMIQSLNKAILSYPASFALWAAVLQRLINGDREIIITGNGAVNSLKAINLLYLPDALVMASDKENNDFPALLGKFTDKGLCFYLCRNYVCREPIYILADFLQLCNT